VVETIIARLLMRDADILDQFANAKSFWDEFFIEHRKKSEAELAKVLGIAQTRFCTKVARDDYQFGKQLMPLTAIGSLYDEGDGFQKNNRALACKVVNAFEQSSVSSVWKPRVAIYGPRAPSTASKATARGEWRSGAAHRPARAACVKTQEFRQIRVPLPDQAATFAARYDRNTYHSPRDMRRMNSSEIMATRRSIGFHEAAHAVVADLLDRIRCSPLFVYAVDVYRDPRIAPLPSSQATISLPASCSAMSSGVCPDQGAGQFRSAPWASRY